MLPREDAAVLVKGVKITGDVDIGDAIRYARGHEEARRYLVEEIGWSLEQFGFVDWKNLDRSLRNKPDGFVTWLSKQHTGFCGTITMVKYYSGDKDADVSCPNCGCVEKAEHLCVCMNPDRTRLLNEMNDDLGVWLRKGNKTDPELAYWITRYIQARGTIRFQDLGRMSVAIKELAKQQDVIGFRNFMEGRISKLFYSIQSVYLSDVEGHMNGRDWVKAFISRLPRMTHNQWLYRNITFHDKQGGCTEDRRWRR